jgi:S2P endopeptidase
MIDNGVLLTAAVAVALVWCLFVVLLRVADFVWPQRVSSFLTRNDVSVNWWSIWFYTSRWNSVLSRWGRAGAWFWSRWFSFGVVVCLVVSVVGILFMTFNLGWLLRPGSAQQPPVMTPMLPFVNIPGSEVLHYFLALAIATGLHELGHALAASSHSCGVEGVGVALITVFPAAFVDLRAQDLEWAPVWVRLKVHCAGAFHNLVLVLAALGLMMILPLLLFPFFTTGNGLYVMNSRIPGVHAGDVITGLNGCRVGSYDEWEACRAALVHGSHQAFCASSQMLAEGSNDHECCEHGYSGSLQCFHAKSKMFCLSARALVLSGAPHCNLTSPCRAGSSCVDASLGLDERIMWISSTRNSEESTTILAGLPDNVLRGGLLLSARVPRSMCPRLFGGLDAAIERLLSNFFIPLFLFGFLKIESRFCCRFERGSCAFEFASCALS